MLGDDGARVPQDVNPPSPTKPTGSCFYFGPFAASAPTRPKVLDRNSSPINTDEAQSEFVNGSALKKRRRFSSPRQYCAPIPIDRVPLPNDVAPDPSIDLNRSADPSCDVCPSAETSQSESSMHEIVKTAAIGAEIGFQVNEDDPVLRGIFIGDGDINMPK
ncbi:hypothetical protein L2E82_05402 [Cichorium intybus]|uniref:Uncharacterized protein n=1 Tax=Cichorium intybus TaxID=13427 RepID=A0ACB9H8J4_CICIN|nr:hypothetical protein L2E82_05402 [Cichorium intybus]